MSVLWTMVESLLCHGLGYGVRGDDGRFGGDPQVRGLDNIHSSHAHVPRRVHHLLRHFLQQRAPLQQASLVQGRTNSAKIIYVFVAISSV